MDDVTEYPSVFSYIGAVVIFVWMVKVLIIFVNFSFTYFITKLKLNSPCEKSRKWAVVTGSSDGIGKAYAYEMAKRGFNVILFSKSLDKLNIVANEIAKKYSVETKALNINFADGPTIYMKIQELIRNCEIGVLVNNVGMSYEYAEYFHAIPNGMDTIFKLIQLNIIAATMMTRMILPKMEKLNNGVIINISSLTALYPLPLLNVYSASKAYVNCLSQEIHKEYSSKNLFIQSVLPGFVSTKMSKKKPSFNVPSSEDYVRSAVRTIGLHEVTFGYISHRIRGAIHLWLKDNIPSHLNMMLSLYLMKKARELYFKKLSKKAARNKLTLDIANINVN